MPPAYPSRSNKELWLFSAIVVSIGIPIAALFAGLRARKPVLSFISTNSITLFGGMLVSALLYDAAFMQKAVEIPAVRLIMLLPLALSPLVIFSIDDVKKVLQTRLQVQHVALAVMFLLLAALLVGRSGNYVSSWLHPDEGFRQLIENIFAIRPRTKEFLFAQPLLFLGFYYRSPIMILLAMVGQVSIINTFLHIHTPFWVSLVRTFHGIWLGLLIACAVVWIINTLSSHRKHRENNPPRRP